MTAGPLLASRRIPVHHGSDEVVADPIDWDPARAAVIICDMWDEHHCVSAAERVVEMAPRMNEVVSGLRAQGCLVIHAPSGCMGFYDRTPQRLLATSAPSVPPPSIIDWNDRDSEREEALPVAMSDPGPCSCQSEEPCCEPGPPYPWTRQISRIEIDDRDAVSDDGHEVYNLLRQAGIRDVLVMGVHANLCVLGRPFGIRQLSYLGMRPLLCRDLTDSFHRDERGHFRGTEVVVAHIERYWCPSVTSDQLVGGTPFSFRGAGGRKS